jgi:hypothetical protein
MNKIIKKIYIQIAKLQNKCFCKAYVRIRRVNVRNQLCIVNHIAQIDHAERGKFGCYIFYANKRLNKV